MYDTAFAPATDEATIRRCRFFASREGKGLLVVNLVVLRSRDPAALWAHADPVGLDNDEHIRCAAIKGAGRVVVAWGAHPVEARVRHVVAMLRRLGAELVCHGMTKDGSPRQPLYVSADRVLIPSNPCRGTTTRRPPMSACCILTPL
jgi:hypothetical protein